MGNRDQEETLALVQLLDEKKKEIREAEKKIKDLERSSGDERSKHQDASRKVNELQEALATADRQRLELMDQISAINVRQHMERERGKPTLVAELSIEKQEPSPRRLSAPFESVPMESGLLTLGSGTIQYTVELTLKR